MTGTTNRRKILVPLATLLAAGAIAVGSGASFTSTSNSATAVTAGELIHTNSRDDLVMDVTNIKPGDSVSGDVVITNDGSIDSTLTLQETAETSGAIPFTAGDLKLKITQAGVAAPLYNDDFGALDNATLLDLGALDVDDSTTLTFTVSMPLSAGNENQGASAGATYKWVSTQVGSSSTQLAWR